MHKIKAVSSPSATDRHLTFVTSQTKHKQTGAHVTAAMLEVFSVGALCRAVLKFCSITLLSCSYIVIYSRTGSFAVPEEYGVSPRSKTRRFFTTTLLIRDYVTLQF